MTKSNKERYRIQGKVYYKEEEEYVNPKDRDIVDEIWKLSNPKGSTFRLMIRRGRCQSFSMYDSEGKHILRTRSISKIED